MAEIIERGNKKKLSTRVDLTPMVDLGFLLITFFIFTTAMSKPTAMKIFLPKSVPESQRQLTAESGALTLLIAGNNQIFYYEGSDPGAMQKTNEAGIRQVITNKKNSAGEKLMVIIKPCKDAAFKTLVKVLDEMTINNVKHYTMIDPEEGEVALLP